MDLIKVAENAFKEGQKEHPEFIAGDTITIHYKIKSPVRSATALTPLFSQ